MLLVYRHVVYISLNVVVVVPFTFCTRCMIMIILTIRPFSGRKKRSERESRAAESRLLCAAHKSFYLVGLFVILFRVSHGHFRFSELL